MKIDYSPLSSLSSEFIMTCPIFESCFNLGTYSIFGTCPIFETYPFFDDMSHLFNLPYLDNQATRIHGGWIDHVYVRKGDTYKDVNVDLYSPYYTALDHDGLLVTMEKKRENIE